MIRASQARPGERHTRIRAPWQDFVLATPTSAASTPLAAVSEELVRLLQIQDFGPGPWVAGGALRDGAAGLPRKDVDLFFDFASSASAFEVALLGGLDGPAFEARQVDDNPNQFDTSLGRLDLVNHLFFQSALEVVDRFDFTACACVLDRDGNLLHHRDFWQHVAERRLVVNALPTPMTAFWRIQRLRARGWQIDETEEASVLWAGCTTEKHGVDLSNRSSPAWAQLVWRVVPPNRNPIATFDAMMRGTRDGGWANETESISALNPQVVPAKPMDPNQSVWNEVATDDELTVADLEVRDFVLGSVGLGAGS